MEIKVYSFYDVVHVSLMLNNIKPALLHKIFLIKVTEYNAMI